MVERATSDEVGDGRVLNGEKEMAKLSACCEDATGLLYLESNYYLETLEECDNRVLSFAGSRCMNGGQGAKKPYNILLVQQWADRVVMQLCVPWL